MSVLKKLRSNSIWLLAISSMLLFLATLVHELFIFLALAPLFAVVDTRIDLRNAYGIFSGLFALAAITLLMREISAATGILFYLIAVMAILTFYMIMQQHTQNRLNKFSLVILLIGVEYLMLKLSMGTWITFLADAVQERTTWIRWNIYVGYLGATAWILLVNLTIYQALLKNDRVNWFLLLLAICVVALPVLYSIDLTNNALTKDQVIRFYKGDESSVTFPYLRYGELISRTGAWLSILIIIFTFVRAKTKKVAR